jgi:chemotaxis protein CheD
MSTITVGIADYKTAKSPDILTTLGLGSCVGVAIYDPDTKIGGLLHVLLPSNNGDTTDTPAKYADTGIPELVRALLRLGAKKGSMVAKIAGGANMFNTFQKSNVFMVGQRNSEMCKEVLKEQKIHLAASDTGGNFGRTIELDTETGKLFVKTIGHGTKYI